jgi:Capsule assembly protein Wzi
MKQLFGLAVLVCSTYFPLKAQIKSVHQVYAEIAGFASSSQRTPFWLHANQFSTVPLSAPIGTLQAGIAGSVLLTDTADAFGREALRRRWVLSYGAKAVSNAGRQNQLLLPEYYVKLAHRHIQFVVGRRQEVIGLVDTTLTSGSYAWSGNALPIPKVQFGTTGFVALGRRRWLAINAFIAHGWFANTAYMQHSFLHQKSVIFRIGKPASPIWVYAGINHNAQWGGHSAYLDYHYAVDGRLPGQLRDFPNVLFAIRMGGVNNARITSFDYVNLYGNHVGSIDFGLELKLASVNLMVYHQHSFDDASGMFFQNAPDGLSGLRIRPAQQSSATFHIDDFLLEFLSTLNQSGPTFYQTATHTKGADNYFNNGQYKEGWTYENQIIGTPFITLRQEGNTSYQPNAGWTINNNRVQVAHVGVRATLAQRISLMAKLSYSRNWGIPGEPLPDRPTQWSSVIQAGTSPPWLGGMGLTASLAADFGLLYPNTVGGYVGLRKTIWRN